MTAAADDLLTADEVSQRYKIARSTLYSWRARDIGPRSIRLVGRIVYRASDVDAWMAAQEATARGGVK